MSRYVRGSRRGLRRWVSAGLVALLVAGACTPVPGPDEPAGPDPELLALLDDPDFVASLGETEEERAELVALLDQYIHDPASWSVDADLLAQAAADKAAADAEAEAAAAAEQAAEDAAVAAETERLASLKDGPSHEELVESYPDGTADYDYSLTSEHWAAMPGVDEAHAKNAATIAAVEAEVDALIAELTRTGELAELQKIPGYEPPQAKDNYVFSQIWADKFKPRPPASGACTGRGGNRAAPAPGLRPGTMYTPVQNTFAGPYGFPEYAGDLKTTTINGELHLVVEGHLGDLDDLNQLPNTGNIWTQLRARLSVHHPGSIATDHDGVGPYTGVWAPGQEIESGDVQVLCYSEDWNLPAGQQIRRGFYRAYIPWLDFNVNELMAEPGFQVRAAITEAQYTQQNGWVPQNFWGADMRTVYLGQEPVGHHDAFENGGFGVSVGKGLVIDDNNYTGDDLESSLRAPVTDALTSALTGLEGTSDWVLGNAGGSYGLWGFHINNSAPTDPNFDIDWVPTKLAGDDDDEYRLRGSLSMDDWLLEMYATVPLSFGVPCYYRMKIDFSATVYASIDINDSAPTQLQPDIEIANVSLNTHSKFTLPFPVFCGVVLAFEWAQKFTSKLNDQLPAVNEQLAEQMALEPAIDNAVPAVIPLGPGKEMHADFFGFNDTCEPYGCNGHKAGDMAMSWAGLEATGDIRFTDSLPPNAPRRFPMSASPTTADTANGRVREHFVAPNEITDVGAWVNPAVLNQALRAITEEGVLDLDFDAVTPGTAKSLPVYLNEPVAADKPLGFWLPHLEIDPQNDANLFAVDFYAGIGVGFDNQTRKLVPADVSPNDPAFGVQMWTLNCALPSWAACAGVPNLITDVLNWGANTVIDPLLEQSIGQVTIPNTGGFDLNSFKILNEDGHLGIRASIGANQVRVEGQIDPSTYGFQAYIEGLPGSGPVTYHWVVRDGLTTAVILDQTTTDHTLSGFDTTTLWPLVIPGLFTKVSAKATVTATRNGVSITGEHQMDLYLP